MIAQTQNQADLEGVLGRETENWPPTTQSPCWEGSPRGHLTVTSWMSNPNSPFWISKNCHLPLSKGLFTHDTLPHLSRHGRGKCPSLWQTVEKLSQGATEQFNGDHTGPVKKGRDVTGIQLIV